MKAVGAGRGSPPTAWAQGAPLTRKVLAQSGCDGGRMSQARTPASSRCLTMALVGAAMRGGHKPIAPRSMAPLWSALWRSSGPSQRWRVRREIMDKRAGLALKRRRAHGLWKRLEKGEKSLLEKSVVESTNLLYLRKEREFWEFVKMQGLKMVCVDDPGSFDRAMVQYADYLYLQGGAVDTMEKVLAAWEAICYGRRGHLKLLRLDRALWGFRRFAPNQVGWQLPVECLFALARGVLQRGLRHLALAICLQFSTYMRPGTAGKIQATDVIAQVRRGPVRRDPSPLTTTTTSRATPTRR